MPGRISGRRFGVLPFFGQPCRAWIYPLVPPARHHFPYGSIEGFLDRTRPENGSDRDRGRLASAFRNKAEKGGMNRRLLGTLAMVLAASLASKLSLWEFRNKSYSAKIISHLPLFWSLGSPK